MDERTRFRETLLFGRPDKVPLEPGEPREHRDGHYDVQDWMGTVMPPVQAMLHDLRRHKPFEERAVERGARRGPVTRTAPQ